MRYRPILISSLAVLAFGCAAVIVTVRKPVPETVAPSCDAVEADATFLTYNVTIAPGAAKQATPRIPVVAEAVRDATYDALCVQEAYSDQAVAAIAEASGLPAENVFMADTRGRNETGRDRCSASAVEGIRECVERKCADVHPDETTSCAARKCKSAAVWLYLFDRPCMNCLIASAGESVEGIAETCVLGGGRSRLYGGRNGMMLLSPHPMRNRTVVHLPSSSVNRVALLATLDLPGGRPVRVACTQLSVPVGADPTHPGFDDWSEEQRAQARAVLTAVRRAPSGMPSVVLGDLGFSIASRAAAPLEAGTWASFADAGYWSPAMHVQPSMCTSCADNTVARGGGHGFLTDHVLFRVADRERFAPACADVLATDLVDFTGYLGRRVRSHRSGHAILRVGAVFPDALVPTPELEQEPEPEAEPEPESEPESDTSVILLEPQILRARP